MERLGLDPIQADECAVYRNLLPWFQELSTLHKHCTLGKLIFAHWFAVVPYSLSLPYSIIG